MTHTSLSGRSKRVVRPPMTWWERSYLPAVLSGMVITFRHFFRRKVTVRYPEQVRPRSPVYRGLHVLKRDEQGAERCTACGLCAVACPAEAITMEAGERQPGEETLYREEKYAVSYDINMLRCIFCGFCEEACPKQAIYLTDRLLPAAQKRRDFMWGKDRLLERPDRRIDVETRHGYAKGDGE